MDRDDQQKIRDLLDSGQGENTYIAIYLMVNEMNISLKEALLTLKPIDSKVNHTNPNDFHCSIRIANIWIEYQYIDGYVPYMGTAATTTRVVSFFENEQQESIEGLSDYLEAEDSNNVDDVRAIILADYHALIPTIIELLGDSDGS
jgi:hypothetical protein